MGGEIVGFPMLYCVSPPAHRVVHSRPKTLDDVTAQDHTITVLQRTLQASNVHLPGAIFDASEQST